MKLSISLLSLTLFTICVGQHNLVKSLSAPVKHAITLSGAFGELRTGHFHSGLDIRSSNGSIGDSIYSISDGYISRLKIEPGGYGNSIYISHTNGLKSVYAHLHSFRPDLQDLASSVQSDSLNFSIDYHLEKDQIIVEQSEFIGTMGNSGNSFGPHLHFEIRDQNTDKLLNPALFGIKPKDTRPPTIQSFSVYQSDKSDHLLYFNQFDVFRDRPGSFSMLRDTLELSASHKTTISFRAFDRMNGSWNKNGLYKYRVFENEQLITTVQFDEMRFADSEYIEFLSDQYQLNNKLSNFHQISILTDSLSIVKSSDDFLTDQSVINYLIQLEDVEGNQSQISFVIRLKTHEVQEIISLKDQYLIDPDTASIIPRGLFMVHFKKGTVPYGRYLYIDNFQSENLDLLSITPSYLPLDKSFSVHYRHTDIDSALLSKLHFSKCNAKGETINLGGVLSHSWLSTELSSLGSYAVDMDTIRPTIMAEQDATSLSSDQEISFIIQDNNKPSSKTQYLQYQLYVDDVPAILSYDLKNDRIYGRPLLKLSQGSHVIRLNVWDCQNNVSIYSKQISTY